MNIFVIDIISIILKNFNEYFDLKCKSYCFGNSLHIVLTCLCSCSFSFACVTSIKILLYFNIGQNYISFEIPKLYVILIAFTCF